MGTVDTKAYTFCVFERLHHALRRRDLLVAPRVRYTDPRSGLLEGKVWAGARPFIRRTLGLPPIPGEALAAMRQQLDYPYRGVVAHLPRNEAVSIEQTEGKEERILSALDKPIRWYPYATRSKCDFPAWSCLRSCWRLRPARASPKS
jgi:hypothetical protein